MSREKVGNKMNIKDYILPSYIEAKPLVTNIDVIFENDILPSEPCDHGQLKCIGLTYPFARCRPQALPILHSQVLYKAEDEQESKNITEVTLDVTEFCSDLKWQPGDTVGIIPSNSTKDVAELLCHMGLEDNADTKCRIEISPLSTKKTAKVPTHLPSPTTPQEIIRDCVNIKCLLKKQFLSSLSLHCTDSDEKSFLKCLSSKDASAFYNDLVVEKGLTLIDILKLCPSCKPPLGLIIEHLGRLLPRPYSIANSPLKNAKELIIIYSTLNVNPGLTTSMLNAKIKEENSSVLVFMREPNLFRFTEEDVIKNQILIAIGTGLAPFLGFLQHKHYVMKQEATTIPGKTLLFVGATTKESVIYRDQLIEWKSINVINRFEEALSRSIPSVENKYVQDSLEKCSQEFADFLMRPDTTLFLCADGGIISKSIEKSITKILGKELELSEDEALKMLMEFKTTGKFREDLWA